MKPIVVVLGIAAASLSAFAWKKKKDFSKVIEKLTWDIHDIKNLRFKSGKLLFDMDIAFHNNTPFEFTFDTAGLIYLRRVNVMYKGKLMGVAMSNTTKFDLFPWGNFLVTGVQVEVQLAELISQIVNQGLDLNTDNYQLELQIEALGNTFLIEQPASSLLV